MASELFGEPALRRPLVSGYQRDIILHKYAPSPSPDCTHEDVGLVKKAMSNGAWMFQMQCGRCGANGTHIAHSLLNDEQKGSAPLRNDDLSSAWREGQMEAARIAREEERASWKEQWYRTYAAYLRSDEWRRRRALIMRRDNNTCQHCLEASATEVHHREYHAAADGTYIGGEPNWLLVSVCRRCHEQHKGTSPVYRHGVASYLYE